MIIATLFAAGCACSATLPDDPQALVDMLARTSDEHAPAEAVAARDKLVEMGKSAFPVLIENSDDNREAWYCFQLQTIQPTTVGVVCICIIQDQIELALPKGQLDMFMLTTASKEELSQWWQERSNWSLEEMQIEAARHSLQKAREWEHFPSEAQKQEVIEMYHDRLKELGAEE
jgi:hypothetical protein